MKTSFYGVLVACFMLGGAPLAADETAAIEKITTGEITENNYPAILTRVDGRQVLPGERRTWLIPAGHHVLSMVPDRDELQKWVVRFDGPLQRIPVPRNFFEKKIEIDAVAGAIYRISVNISSDNYADWQPVITEVKPESVPDKK